MGKIIVLNFSLLIRANIFGQIIAKIFEFVHGLASMSLQSISESLLGWQYIQQRSGCHYRVRGEEQVIIKGNK